ncbi:MAG: D-alanyl-D-alanine carboxypeptidase DacC [Alphaproteobacteria bacterium MarineAlpha5_Bin12]|nr:D-alanyl-D-alanine carboxypeptidase [Pelagibacteraceae bacterium]PPR41901.1 MAG: D-alanyl-D-alanine carboxypeptidase DacC [Alphaproteobacteria bacterium MarineAlpha5_Bin12]|tara:strand:- start:7882 stop:9012 length:1131 start_codon:yes stop_codon:yes gene_type:complete
MKHFFLILIFTFFNISNLSALNSIATHAIIYDYQTNEILYEKNAFEKTPPASTTKILTSYIVFDQIKKGNLKLNDKFRVSEKAYKKGGSSMFLEINSMVTVEDLLYGIIVQSGNDASIVVAENISGSERAFTDLMNEYATKIGMKNSNFVNSSGWPHPLHYSTMYDLAVLSKAIIRDFPDMYKMYSEKEFTYNNITQPNRNSLLELYEGTDGLKTGYVKDSGYGIVVSTLKKNRRIIIAVNGLESRKSRVIESERLLNWAFRNTKLETLFKKGEVVKKTDVWLGTKNQIDLIVGQDILTTLKSEQKDSIDTKIIYDKPIEAPILKNQEIGKIIIEIKDKDTLEFPLYAKDSIKKINPLFRVFSAIRYLIFGNINND